METFLAYLTRIISHPSQTFEKLAKEKNIQPYLIVFLIFEVIRGLINLLFPLPTQLTNATSPLMNELIQISEKMDLFSFITYPLLYLLSGAVLHSVNKRFSKKGTLLHLLAAQGFILLLTVPFIIAIEYLNPPGRDMIITLFSIYGLFLTVLAVSAVYGLSKIRSFINVLLGVIINGLLLFAIMYLITLVV
jgi:hypothetical protein